MTSIVLDNVTKRYRTRHGIKTVLDGVDLCVSSGNTLGVMGCNGAGKSTLIRLLSGAEVPSKGTVSRKMSVSWPLAFGGGFQGSLTGVDNIRFICRVYGADIREATCFVDDFAELGDDLYEPVKHYSTGMATRLAFGISMAINFDCYLIDEVIAVGDSRFHQKCIDELFIKRAATTKIIVSHQPDLIRAYCNRAAIIANKKITSYENVGEAVERYVSG